MKAFLSGAVILGLVGMSSSNVLADEQDKGGRDREALIKKYDKNGDGKLDEQEREAAQKELGNNAPGKGKPGAGRLGNLESNPKLLKHFDKNGDGKLDDTERAAAQAEMQKRRADKNK